MTDDLGDFPALDELPDEVRSSDPDAGDVAAPDPDDLEDDPAVEHIAPTED